MFVDRSCVDCDTCRWMAPEIFRREGDMSVVFHQPETEGERERALQALLSCPTASIGTEERPKDIKQVQESFPIAIAENVYHCGYHSEKSYGAASYLIQRPEGNISIDSPRFAPPLVKRIEALGGIRYLFLTHRDDVADCAKWQAHFNCDRVLHADDITAKTADVEIQPTGLEPFALTDDFTILAVPGHTRGHTVGLYRDRFLFSGDHLAFSPRVGHLYAFRNFCWYDWEIQLESMRRLAAYDFEWVLPGHGRRYHGSYAETRSQMARCLHWMEAEA